MRTEPDGGPAFPVPVAIGPYGLIQKSEQDGMTLRDWFKGQALKGILSNPAMIDTFSDEALAVAVERAGFCADAMLKERER